MIYTKLFFILFTFSLLSCSSAEKSDQSDKTDETKIQEESPNNIDFENAVFVDVRTPEEFASGSFTDAMNIPLSSLETRLSELDKNDQVVVFCKSGGRASRAARILENAGFTNVVNGINTSNLNKLQNN